MYRYAFAILAFIATTALAQDVIQPGGALPSRSSQGAAAIPRAYIVSFAPGTSAAERANTALAAGAPLRHNYASVSAMAVTVPNDAALESIRRNPRVTRITPDHVISTQARGGGGKPPGVGGGGGVPPVSFDTRQVVSNEVQRVGWPTPTSHGQGIGVAVIDSGIDLQHPDLAPSATAFNGVNGASCDDDGGHGTHVAGMIAALNNGIGIIGVAPAATLYCVKVLTSMLTGDESATLAGLDWVIQNHASVTPPIRVVNMSLGRPLDIANGETLTSAEMRTFIQALYNLGIVVVASAGNDPNREITDMIPSGFPEVISVASTTATHGIRTCLLFGIAGLTDVQADTASDFTTDGPGVTISAPGEQHTDIVSLGSAGCAGLQYGTLSTTMNTTGATRKIPSGAGLFEARGSSFAAPLVSGAVARLLQMGLVPLDSGTATVEAVRTWIVNNASRRTEAPLSHPWADPGELFFQSFDGVREGVLQAPF